MARGRLVGTQLAKIQWGRGTSMHHLSTIKANRFQSIAKIYDGIP